jgi:sigma-B regulation protein RsbU (phosphoserine phosphatase)
MFPETEYEVAEILLHARDLLVLYSDGITDAGQREGKDFGEERLRSLVMLVADLTLTEIQARILTSVRSWSGSEPEDDMTLVLVRSQGHQSGGTE